MTAAAIRSAGDRPEASDPSSFVHSCAAIAPISTEPSVLEEHSRDASRAEPSGLPVLIAFPRSAAEVSALLRTANEFGIPVVTRGAGTGLSGGAIAAAGCLVISTRNLTELEVDPVARTASVGAGVITAELDRAAATHGLMYAPDPVSSETSTIGGNIATNAGGPRCLSYGVTADAVRELEVVLADGRIIRTGSQTIKNSTGYDLTRLFIGSEGTLGVVTRAVVRLREAIPAERTAFAISHPDLETIGRLIQRITGLATNPVSLELMDANTLDVVAEHFPDIMLPQGSAMLAGEYAGDAIPQRIDELRALCDELDAEISVGDRAEEILLTRMRVNPALNRSGLVASCDVVLPLPRLTDMLAEIPTIAVRHGMRVNTFAHAGDGNLHPAVVADPDDPASLETAERVLDDITARAIELGGMISGEHGIGSLKTHHLTEQFSPDMLGLMHQIKQALDPRGILNPGRAI